MAGLIGVGRNTLSQATGGFSAVGGMQQQRNAMNDQLDAARKAQRVSMATTGAGLGASVGVNNLMRQGAAKVASTVSPNIAGTTATALPSAGTAALGEAGTAVGTAAGTGATATAGAAGAAGAGGAATAAPISAAIAADTAATTGAVTTALEGASVAGTTAGGSTGLLAGVGAIATPLLIGAGAALLLDSLFDIF